MFKLNKKTEYGLLALQYITSQPLKMATAREIADAYNISPTLLAKVLQSLAKKGIVESVQGAQGGYRVTSDPQDLSIARVVEAIEGPIHITDCYLHTAGCERTPECTLRDRFGLLQNGIMNQLNTVSLAQFFKE